MSKPFTPCPECSVCGTPSRTFHDGRFYCDGCVPKAQSPQDRIAALESALQKAERERDEANSGLADLEEQMPEDRAEIRKLEIENATLRAQVAISEKRLRLLRSYGRRMFKFARKYRREWDELRAALAGLRADIQCPIDLYDKNGPEWTSEETGSEYYSAEYVLGKMAELRDSVDTALARCQPASAAATQPEGGKE